MKTLKMKLLATSSGMSTMQCDANIFTIHVLTINTVANYNCAQICDLWFCLDQSGNAFA